MQKSAEQLKKSLESVVGITITPFSEDDSIDEAAYTALVQRCVNAGITVLTPNGNTSEFYSLSPAERIRSVELTRQAAPNAIIIAGVGLDSQTAAEETQQYQDMGVDAVMLHQPIHPFWSAEGWIASHRELASAVPNMPIIPYIRSKKITASVLKELLEQVPEVLAVKYAIDDPVSFAEVVNLVPQGRATWICGLAEMWAPFFAIAGATGFTSGLVSVDPDRSLRMLEALHQKDYVSAMKEQQEIADFEALRARNASEMNVTAVKEALGQLGLCSAEVRAPLSRLNSTDRELVSSILKRWAVA
ncbi:MAG: dihydrodipicolinate synthase family protein [Microbacteriaceae bacterium]